jgi:hypothetical protein
MLELGKRAFAHGPEIHHSKLFTECDSGCQEPARRFKLVHLVVQRARQDLDEPRDRQRRAIDVDTMADLGATLLLTMRNAPPASFSSESSKPVATGASKP